MESLYFYIVIAGVASLLTNESAANFRGASGYAKLWLTFSAIFGVISFVGFIITSFFFIEWWHSILIFGVTLFLSWLFGMFGRNGFVGLACSFLILIFNALAWSNLIKIM